MPIADYLQGEHSNFGSYQFLRLSKFSVIHSEGRRQRCLAAIRHHLEAKLDTVLPRSAAILCLAIGIGHQIALFRLPKRLTE